MTYEELYHKIQSQYVSTRMIANRAFQWVMCSCSPLSPAELVAAVCQDPDTDKVDEIDINIDIILIECQNLIVVDQELDVCRFAHFSVQQYLEEHHWKSCKPDCLAAKVCLSLLTNNSVTSEQDPRTTNREGKGGTNASAHDVLKYARLHWKTHVQRLGEKGINGSRVTALRQKLAVD